MFTSDSITTLLSICLIVVSFNFLTIPVNIIIDLFKKVR